MGNYKSSVTMTSLRLRSLGCRFMKTRDDLVYLIDNHQTILDIFKMTKTRTAMFLVLITLSCALIFSITDAFPTAEPEALENDGKLGNNSRLVITNVVKTIEFEVGVIDDDGEVEGNSTESDSSEFFETNIQLLNVDLLKEVVNQADEEENKEETLLETQGQTSGTEEQIQHMDKTLNSAS